MQTFNPVILAFVLLTLCVSAAPAAGPGSALAGIPPALRDWVPWVLKDGDRRTCPVGITAAQLPRVDSALAEQSGRGTPSDGRICAWPGRLFLDLNSRGGVFAQRWETRVETWVPLPGDADSWPLDARAGDAPLPVVLRDGFPAVRLAPGSHLISGRFQWPSSPNGLSLPPETGLVSVALDGEIVESPRLDRGGRLWIGDPPESGDGQVGDALEVRVFRLIDDDLPLRVVTRLELDVSGRARQGRLGPVLLDGGVALRVQSPLPARLDDDSLLVQLRPGHWVLELDSYHPGGVTELSRPPARAPWPQREHWSFAAHPALRQVSVQGPAQVDPRQSGVPSDWSRLPAYVLDPGERMQLSPRRRGNPDPGPDRLRLSRELWLDFDGGGYSVQDRISGQLTRSWRLEAEPPLVLGQVRVSGQPRMITTLADAGAGGVEVRRGRLDLVADARLGPPLDRLPVASWDLDLASVQTNLHLPPGWDLLAVTGADNLPDSWVSRWSLLDLFLVLVLVIGVQRLWGWRWGLVALAALALTWNLDGAPRLVWIQVLAATALLRVLPGGETGVMTRLRSALLWYFRLALLALVLIALPFLVEQVRESLYPQLDRPWTLVGGGHGGQAAMLAPSPAKRASAVHNELGDSVGSLADGALAITQASAPAPARAPALDDPRGLVQSGPGVPDWRWRQVVLTWGGPVTPEEQVRLWLLSPRWSAVLGLAGAALIALLVWRLSGLGGGRTVSGRGGADGRSGGAAAAALLLFAVIAAALPGGSSVAHELPSPELLRELQSRLREPPDCLPECVALPILGLQADPHRLRLSLTLDAAVPVAAPIPGGPGGWWPSRLSIDSEPLDAVRRGPGDELLIAVPAGRHRILLEGPLPAASQVEIPFPLRPMQVQVELDGWTLEGLDPAGRPGPQVRLLRLAGAGAMAPDLTQGALPPLLAVERTLRIGASWRVETRVRRLSPAQFPVVQPVPLLPGESIQTSDAQVSGGAVLASLAPGETQAAWDSVLEQVPLLRLVGAEDPKIAETWVLRLGSMWHLEWSGPSPVQQQTDEASWLPRWRPLPGETLELRISRPPAVPGPTLTLDSVRYDLEPGARARECRLSLGLRSTRGGSHLIGLPPGAVPIRLSVDGRDLPLPPQGGRLELALVPGTQRASLQWREPGGVGMRLAPAPVDLGGPAVNLDVSVTMPPDRWVLFAAGPGVGPVVMFWGVLLVFVFLAIGLARMAPTPLKLSDWLLLGVGLAAAQPLVAVLVVGWLLAIGLRRRLDERASAWRYNLVQAALVLLTLLALAGLFDAVSEGLLGRPEMQIGGNGSHGNLLRWYLDRGGPGLPEITVYSLPMWLYRGLMLAWALWLAVRILGWLRWGWEAFSRPVPWREASLALRWRGFRRRASKGGE